MKAVGQKGMNKKKQCIETIYIEEKRRKFKLNEKHFTKRKKKYRVVHTSQ